MGCISLGNVFKEIPRKCVKKVKQNYKKNTITVVLQNGFYVGYLCELYENRRSPEAFTGKCHCTDGGYFVQ